MLLIHVINKHNIMISPFSRRFFDKVKSFKHDFYVLRLNRGSAYKYHDHRNIQVGRAETDT